jgi:protein-tyrosine phosphatase
MKILMVCLGNICRSPLAEGILRQKAREKNLPIITDSCGTGGWHAGEAPDERSIRVAKLKGVDISDLKARKFKLSDFENFDLIFTMDTQNTTDVLAMARSEKERKKVIQILNLLEPNSFKKVPDPYYGTMDDFEEVYQLLDEACNKIISLYEQQKLG